MLDNDVEVVLQSAFERFTTRLEMSKRVSSATFVIKSRIQSEYKRSASFLANSRITARSASEAKGSSVATPIGTGLVSVLLHFSLTLA